MKRLIFLALAVITPLAAQLNCNVETLRGTYSVSYLGWTSMMIGQTQVTSPGTIFGVASISADGKISGAAAVGGFGPVHDYLMSGTVDIKPDCTGVFTLKVKPKVGAGYEATEIDRFVFHADEGLILATIQDMGPAYFPAVLGTWKRLSRTPGAAQW